MAAILAIVAPILAIVAVILTFDLDAFWFQDAFLKHPVFTKTIKFFYSDQVGRGSLGPP